MTLTAGAITLLSAGPTTANLSATAATGGTGPYTYQWYRSTTAGFTPGAGNIISGATALTLNDTGLIPGTQYYYDVVATDTGNGNATIADPIVPVATTPPVFQQNSFAQQNTVGQVDLRFPFNTVSVQIDSSQATPLYAGAAVKIVDSGSTTGGDVPKVVGCTANTDEVMGFINYDTKSVSFPAGNAAEISMAGNVVYLYATGAISRGTRVCLDLSTNGGVTAYVGSSGKDIVGWAYDKASAAGALIRVFLLTPSFLKA